MDTDQQLEDGDLDDSFVLTKPVLAFMKPQANKNTGTGFQFGRKSPLATGPFGRIAPTASPLPRGLKNNHTQADLQTSSKIGGPSILGRQVAGTILRGKGTVSDLPNSELPRETPATPRQPLTNIALGSKLGVRHGQENITPVAVQNLPFLSPTPQVEPRAKSPINHQTTIQELPFNVVEVQTKPAAARVVSPVNLSSLTRSAKSQDSYQHRQPQPLDEDRKEHHDRYEHQHQRKNEAHKQDYCPDYHPEHRQDHLEDQSHGYQLDQQRPNDAEQHQAPHQSPVTMAPPPNRVTKERTGLRPYLSTKKLALGTKSSSPIKLAHPPHRSREQTMNRPLIPSPPEPVLAGTWRTARGHSAAKDIHISGSRYRNPRQPSSYNSQGSSRSSEAPPPSPKNQEQNIKAATNFTNSMAGIINQYNQQQRSALDKQRAQYKKQIKSLERGIAKSTETATHYRARSEAKSKELKELQVTGDEMVNKIRELELKLEASEIQPKQLSEKIRELEKKWENAECENIFLTDKHDELKSLYKKAVSEQQNLYHRSMARCEETIRELQEITDAKKAAAESAVEKAEAIREELLQRVRQEIAQHKIEASELGRQIEDLTKQNGEKDAELRQQNETICTLSAKVHELENSSKGFEILAAQNQEIGRKIEDQGSQTHQQIEGCAKETRDKLESVSNGLDALATSMSTQPEIISGIQATQAREFESIGTKIDAIIEFRVFFKETTSGFSTELDTQMAKIWQRLDSQIGTLTQQLAQKAEENGMLSALYKEKETACERLKQDVEGLQKTSAEQIEKIHALQERDQENQLAMEAAHEDDQQHKQELIKLLQASEAETGRLKDELDSKVDSIVKLEDTLRAKEEEYAAGLRNFSTEILKLNQALGDKDRANRDAIERVVELTLRETGVKMEETMAIAKKALDERDEHVNALEAQLEELRKSLHDKEQNQHRDACTLSSLREALSTTESKEKSLAEKLTLQSVKFEEREAQIRCQMDTANAELEATKRKVAEYEGELQDAKKRATKFEGDSHNQRARAQALFEAVKAWAREGSLDTVKLDEICDESKSAEEIGRGLSQALAQLGLSQRLQASHHENRDDLLLDRDKSHFNSANGEHTLLLSQDSHTSSIHSGDGTNASAPAQPQDVLALVNSRRVVVRSPANDPDSPTPLSISEEKTRRREGLQPKSIMKTTVARVTRSVSLKAQRGDSENTFEDEMLQSSRNEHLMASSPDPLPSNGTVPSTLTAMNPHSPLVVGAHQAGQHKRKQPDDPGPDIFVNRPGKPRTSQMTEDIETETLAQLEEIVGSKRRSAKKRPARTYGAQRPPESSPNDDSPSTDPPTLQLESLSQFRHFSEQPQSQGSQKSNASQEFPGTSEDSTETVTHTEALMKGGRSSTRLPPLRRNTRRRS
ncbi:hypothetical protein QBC43DRAFT_286959 [Cladorrhinum sp. PSN259]|nr:hypothetical protein QBC43DRAFT_286959 [Cladorrhinum sp. PSN259]